MVLSFKNASIKHFYPITIKFISVNSVFLNYCLCFAVASTHSCFKLKLIVVGFPIMLTKEENFLPIL